MRRRGNMAVEAAMLIPVLVLLIVGIVQFGKITYQYFTLKKMVWAAGRQIASLQGVNFCDLANDAAAQGAITLAVNDPATGLPIVDPVTTLDITPECADADGALAACGTCPDLNPQPAYVLVQIPGGYEAQVRIPFLNPIPVTLSPYALAPVGGSL